jgi:hypothetical protein
MILVSRGFFKLFFVNYFLIYHTYNSAAGYALDLYNTEEYVAMSLLVYA